MKKFFIFAILVLTSGAFIGLIVDQGMNSTTMTGGDERGQLMWGIVDSIVVIVCFFHCRQLVRVASRQPWILAFVGWATLSLAWSDFPMLTMRRVAGLICTMALGFLLGMRLELKPLLRLLAWALAFTMPASLIAALFFPAFGLMHRLDAVGWRGVFSHKNGLGNAMGIALIAFACLLWESRRKPLRYILPLVTGLGLLALSRSMTSIVVTLLTLSIGLYLRLRLRPAHKVALYATALLVALGAGLALNGRMHSVFALVGRDSSLTGRIPLWHFSANAMLERPLLGSGWDAFWPGKGGDKIRNLVRWPAPHAHNGFLELGLNVGLIGLVIFLIAYYKSFRLALRYSNDPTQPLRLWPLLFYSYTLLSNFTEAPPIDRHTLTFLLFCSLSVSMTEGFAVEVIEHERERDMPYLPFAVESNAGIIQESL
jgi:exopolysaccharide production protein ExoQ